VKRENNKCQQFSSINYKLDAAADDDEGALKLQE